MGIKIVRILLIIPTLKQGGAERVMSILANRFISMGHEVNLLFLSEPSCFYRVDSKVQIYTLHQECNNTRFAKLYAFFMTFKLRSVLKSVNPDFVLSFMTPYNIFTLISGIGLNLNIFVSDRSNPNKKLPFLTRLLRNIFYRNAVGIIAQTELAKDSLYNITKHKNIKVIYNPIEVSLIPLNTREKYILNVGRLVKEKGQSYLLDAFSRVPNLDWKLVLLGDGPLKEQLLEQIEKLNLTDRVLLLGSVDNVEEWYSKSSIFAFSSISEGFPNALAEAMCAGLPCVSFDCDTGPRDIIKNNINGFLVPTGESMLLKEKIIQLINDKDLRCEIGEEAAKIKNDLDSDSIASLYLNFCTGK